MRADDIIDRQRLRRKLTFWRIAAVCVALVAILAVANFFTGSETLGEKASAHVAKVKIEGAITEDEDLLKRLADLEENDHVKGVILSIDSPGGTTVGGEAIYEAVRKLADKKPVVAQVGTLAASAGYMIAVGTDQIVARKSSIVGSIGVIFQYPNVEQLLENLGIDMRSIKSSPLKAEPTFFGETPPGAEAMIRRMIMDSYDWFKGIVTERRDFTAAKTDSLADGSVFTGRQAKANGLIDQLGGEDVARAWLTEKGVDADLETVLWERAPQRRSFFLADAFAAFVAQQLGLNISNDTLNQTLGKRLMLDGLLSVWHVQEN